MTPRARVEAVLRGQTPDRLPFVIWNNKLPAGPTGEAVLESGACVIVKSGVGESSLRTIKTQTRSWLGPDGRQRRREVHHTPLGPLCGTRVYQPGTVWWEEWPFKSEADYDRLLAVIEDTTYAPCYERFLAADAAHGDRGLARPATEKSPLFEIIYEIMGMTTFAVQWQEHRDRLMELYQALLAARRRRLAILAESPAQFAVVDGNIEMSVVGAERFARYYAPPIEEACRIVHDGGKLAGAHLDANNRLLAEPMARLPVDIVESLTPPPDCDLSIAQARAVWPEKILMVNFPSSVHLGGPDAVRRTARRLVAQARRAGRVILGVIEDVPRQDTLPVLAEAVRDFGGQQG